MPAIHVGAVVARLDRPRRRKRREHAALAVGEPHTREIRRVALREPDVDERQAELPSEGVRERALAHTGMAANEGREPRAERHAREALQLRPGVAIGRDGGGLRRTAFRHDRKSSSS